MKSPFHITPGLSQRMSCRLLIREAHAAQVRNFFLKNGTVCVCVCGAPVCVCLFLHTIELVTQRLVFS